MITKCESILPLDTEIFGRTRSEEQLKEKAKSMWGKYFDVDSELAITLDDNIDLHARVTNALMRAHD